MQNGALTLLFDDERVPGLHPLTLTRPAGDLRVGILTVREKWEQRLGRSVALLPGPGYLRPKFGPTLPSDPETEVLLLNGRFLPSPEWLERMLPSLGLGEAWHESNGNVLCARLTVSQLPYLSGFADVVAFDALCRLRLWRWTEPPRELERPSDVFRLNGAEIRRDYTLLTASRPSAPLSDPHTRVYRPDWVFAEPGVKIRAAVLNAEEGPIYLGHDADIQEGAIIHGSHAILEHAVINMGAKLRGDSSIGPHCKVGGEVSNSVFWGYSNKAHDGFLGNSVLGQWCNLGADTNTSNLKNTYGSVALYDYLTQSPADTGLTFVGLVMGDHSKAGINTMFNTGTVVGVSSNVFGGGFPPKYVPSFRWGSETGFADAPRWSVYDFEKALTTAERVMARRGHRLDATERALLQAVFDLSHRG